MEKGIIRVCGFSMAAVWRFLPKTDSHGVKPITRAAAISRFQSNVQSGSLIQSLNVIRFARAACRNFESSVVMSPDPVSGSAHHHVFIVPHIPPPIRR
jgi:hypothetical protein